MQFRRPLPQDFPKMVQLHNQNLLNNLTPSEQASGFLSASFSEEQFQAMDQDLCVVVCTDSDKLCGYACAGSIQYNQNIPLVAAMIARFPEISYQGRPLSSYHPFIYGPVCIDREYRGQGLLPKLIETLLSALPPGFDALTTLISKDNQRSIHAHQKLGIEKIGEFEFNGQSFLILTKKIEAQV